MLHDIIELQWVNQINQSKSFTQANMQHIALNLNFILIQLHIKKQHVLNECGVHFSKHLAYCVMTIYICLCIQPRL